MIQAIPIVAIGASAGGLAAIEELLKSLDPETGMGFVILMHLEANHKSRYPEIIARMTSMKVFEATEGTVIERNCVYVMAAGVNLTVAEGVLHTTVRTESPAHNKPESSAIVVFPIDNLALSPDRQCRSFLLVCNENTPRKEFLCV